MHGQRPRKESHLNPTGETQLAQLIVVREFTSRISFGQSQRIIFGQFDEEEFSLHSFCRDDRSRLPFDRCLNVALAVDIPILRIETHLFSDNRRPSAEFPCNATQLTDFAQFHVAGDSVGIEQTDDARLDLRQGLLAALVVLRHSDALRARGLSDKDQGTRHRKGGDQTVLSAHMGPTDRAIQ